MKPTHFFWAGAIVFALLALAPMPGIYYKLIRFAVPICVGVIAYSNYERNGGPDIWLFAFLAIIVIFNPLLPFYLGRALWQVVDVAAAAVVAAHYVMVERRR